jgi:drug/metabolite transporter (DMT)-like permease
VVGALIGRVAFKQRINARMAVGILLCLSASVMIGSTSLGAEAPAGMFWGLLVALGAAVGWGVEGAVAGYGTVLIDYQVGIAIRQLTAGLLNLGLFVPVLFWVAGQPGLLGPTLAAAVTSPPAIGLLAISGLFSFLSFGLWYRGNSMCGTALGMACNGSYSFFTPLACWLILGVALGQPGWGLAPTIWVAAAVMFCGLVLVAVNPLALLRGRELPFTLPPASAGAPDAPGAVGAPVPALSAGTATRAKPGAEPILPVNFVILRHLGDHGPADPDQLMAVLAQTACGGRTRRPSRQEVAEALAAAEKSGVLEVSGVGIGPSGDISIQYRPSPHGRAMIHRFIGPQPPPALPNP